MNATSGVSVVIPAYNVEHYLGACLDSVIAQTHDQWECLVVDDGSTDGTGDVAQMFASRDARISVLRQDNAGPARARNTGFRRSDPSFPYVTFMDSDDVWLPYALEALLARLQKDDNAIGAHGLAEFIDEHGDILEPGRYSTMGRHRLGLVGHRLEVLPLSCPTDFNVLVNGNVLFPPGLLLARRETYLQAGPFDETFRGPEDWDILIRLSRYGYIAFLDRVILHYRRHSHNLGAQPGIARQAHLVRCKNFHSPANSPYHRKMARKGWRAYQRQLLRRDVGTVFARPAQSQPARARAAAHALLCLFRYLRGYPLPVVRRPSETW